MNATNVSPSPRVKGEHEMGPGWSKAGSQPRGSNRQSDAALVRQAQAGNREALEELLHRYWKVLLRRARRPCGNCSLVEDLCQETCLRLISHLSNLREPQAFTCWIQTFVANAVRNCRRKNCKKICTPPEDDDPYLMESLSVEAASGADADWQWLWNLLWRQASVKDGRCGRVAAFMLEHYAQNERFPSVRTIARAMQISNPTAQDCRRATLLNWRHALRDDGFCP